MTGKVVSLSKRRKAKARAERKHQADANAAKFGRNTAERATEARQRGADVKRLDDHKRDDT